MDYIYVIDNVIYVLADSYTVMCKSRWMQLSNGVYRADAPLTYAGLGRELSNYSAYLSVWRGIHTRVHNKVITSLSKSYSKGMFTILDNGTVLVNELDIKVDTILLRRLLCNHDLHGQPIMWAETTTSLAIVVDGVACYINTVR